ncbi:lipopolysaccharide assembly LapA domain-containing protein [Bacillus salitolerans]|uniref:Lipopolysaccharide assembly LapA domain-containing protein n=1 Tax=Bacillus salitolerans TaxID=1437434 RepID=A0ABW4LLK6_9BACI
MKNQWILIVALLFALIVAVFAVVNVNPVRVDYVFGVSEWPLILVILGSAVLGAFAVGAAGIFRLIMLQKNIKQLQKENEQLRKKVNEHVENEQLRKQNYERDIERNRHVIEVDEQQLTEDENLANRE